MGRIGIGGLLEQNCMANFFLLSVCFVPHFIGQQLRRQGSLSVGSSFVGILYSLTISLGLEVKEESGESRRREGIYHRKYKRKMTIEGVSIKSFLS